MGDNLRVFACHMELTLDIIGGKWKPIIIYHVGSKQALRYSELKRLIPFISERVLSRELRALEESNLITKTVSDDKPAKVVYALSDVGKEVLPVLTSLAQWGQKYNSTFNYAVVECDND